MPDHLLIKSINENELELAEYIIGKFPAPVRTARPVILLLPCPCDTCRLHTVCGGTGHECQAFRQFVKSGQWDNQKIADGLR